MHTTPTQFETDLQNFFITWNNQPNDFDKNGDPECVDIVKQYFNDILKMTPIHGNAQDYWKPLQGFTQVPKDQPPKFGDLAIFDFKPVGHIAIVNNFSQSVLGCFGANDPLKSPCHFRNYDYSHVVGYQRPVNISSLNVNQTPKKFTLHYTVINSDPNLLEQARQLLVKLSGGKLDCTFQYSQMVPIHSPSLFPTEEQMLFLKNFPQTTPFVFLTYLSDADPGFVNMVTKESPGSTTIVTACKGTPDSLNICFEFTHALCKYMVDHGHSIEDVDVNTPSEAFLQEKINHILLGITNLLS